MSPVRHFFAQAFGQFPQPDDARSDLRPGLLLENQRRARNGRIRWRRPWLLRLIPRFRFRSRCWGRGCTRSSLILSHYERRKRHHSDEHEH